MPETRAAVPAPQPATIGDAVHSASLLTAREAGPAAAARLLLARPPGLGRTRLGVVDGPSGSGKSTFAPAWAAAVRAGGCENVIVFSSDLLATWDDPFGWWVAFDTGVLQPISQGRSGRVQLTDWSGGSPRPGGRLTVPVPDVLILEGVSSGRRALEGRAGVLVWIEFADRPARLERAVGRDGESSRAHLTAWQHDEDRFFAGDRTAERADLVVTAGDAADDGLAG